MWRVGLRLLQQLIEQCSKLFGIVVLSNTFDTRGGNTKLFKARGDGLPKPFPFLSFRKIEICHLFAESLQQSGVEVGVIISDDRLLVFAEILLCHGFSIPSYFSLDWNQCVSLSFFKNTIAADVRAKSSRLATSATSPRHRSGWKQGGIVDRLLRSRSAHCGLVASF